MWAAIKPWGNQFRPAWDCLINCIPYQRGHLPSISLKQSPVKYSGHHVCYRRRSSRRILSVPKPWTIFFWMLGGDGAGPSSRQGVTAHFTNTTKGYTHWYQWYLLPTNLSRFEARKNNIQVKVRKTTQLYCQESLQERKTETDTDGLSGSTLCASWLLVNVCVRCSVSFSCAAAILCSEPVPFRTFIKDPPVLCRGFIDRIIMELISISLQEKVTLIMFTVPSKIYQSREDRRQRETGLESMKPQSRQRLTTRGSFRKLVCSFLMESQSVPQNINVWLATGSDSSQKLGENKAARLFLMRHRGQRLFRSLGQQTCQLLMMLCLNKFQLECKTKAIFQSFTFNRLDSRDWAIIQLCWLQYHSNSCWDHCDETPQELPFIM